MGSFRLPHELLVELGDTARRLGLPVGMIVTAAITQLLDQPLQAATKTVIELIFEADMLESQRIAELVDARIHGRRHARRRLADPTGR